MLFLLGPWLEELPWGRTALSVILTAVLASAAASASSGRGQRALVWTLAIAAVGLRWSTQQVESRALDIAASAVMVASIAVILALLLRQVLGQGAVTRDKLMGALSGYLLIGLLFATGYTLINSLQPGSFSVSGVPVGAGAWNGSFYYSLVTLTTLGYGDILPLTTPARSLAAFEAYVGVMYVAVLVARMVGLHMMPPGNGDA